MNDRNAIIWALVVGGIAAFVAVAIAAGRFTQAKRTERLRAVAAELGLTYVPETEFTNVALPQGFWAFTNQPRTVRHLLHGNVRGVSVWIFDCVTPRLGLLQTGPYDHASTTTLVRLQAPGLRLPPLAIRPKRFPDNFGPFLAGSQAIYLPDHPAFSARYHLRGDPYYAPCALTEAVVRGLHQSSTLFIEGWGEEMLFYDSHMVIKPQALRSRLDEALWLLSLFRGDQQNRY